MRTRCLLAWLVPTQPERLKGIARWGLSGSSSARTWGPQRNPEAQHGPLCPQEEFLFQLLKLHSFQEWSTYFYVGDPPHWPASLGPSPLLFVPTCMTVSICLSLILRIWNSLAQNLEDFQKILGFEVHNPWAEIYVRIGLERTGIGARKPQECGPCHLFFFYGHSSLWSVSFSPLSLFLCALAEGKYLHHLNSTTPKDWLAILYFKFWLRRGHLIASL